VHYLVREPGGTKSCIVVCSLLLPGHRESDAVRCNSSSSMHFVIGIDTKSSCFVQSKKGRTENCSHTKHSCNARNLFMSSLLELVESFLFLRY
jgi:hypothetical protein